MRQCHLSFYAQCKIGFRDLKACEAMALAKVIIVSTSLPSVASASTSWLLSCLQCVVAVLALQDLCCFCPIDTSTNVHSKSLETYYKDVCSESTETLQIDVVIQKRGRLDRIVLPRFHQFMHTQQAFISLVPHRWGRRSSLTHPGLLPIR